MTPLQSFNLIDSLTKAIAVLDEKSRANQEYNSYMLWFDDYKTLRSELVRAIETAKNIEVIS